MKYIKLFRNFIRELYEKKYLIYQLTKRDFKQRFVGSWLGIIWSFIQPLFLAFILWFLFSVGLRGGGGSDEEIPRLIYFLTGLAVWTFFSEAISQCTNVFNQYAFLVKKIQFKVSILPIVKILSTTLIHLCMMIIVIAFILGHKLPASFYWFQTLYYIVATMALLLGLSWILGSLNVFTRDIMQFVKVVLTLGFWICPIIWSIDMIPEQYQFYVKLNPLFYIIEGYRESLLYMKPFWHDTFLLIYFWGFCFICFITGVLVFNRLRPHFMDVL